MIEPSTPAEAKDMMKYAYEVSEALTLPVIYRTTTRVNHARSIVEYGPVIDTPAKGHFKKDDKRFINIPAFAKLNRLRLLELYKKAQELSESSPLNFIEGEGSIGIITSGVSYTYVKEYTSGAAILKLGFTNPLPEKKIADFIRDKEYVIIVEELEPFLEDQVFRICAQNNIRIPVYGKRSGHLPREWEYSPDTMKKLKDLLAVRDMPAPLPSAGVKLPNRPATLCTGCPHRGMFAASKKAVGKREVVFCTDIGCYTLGMQPPFHAADFLICMGGGAGAAGGFDKATDQKAVAFIGDSTFFHSGAGPLTSAIFNDHKIVMVILDNRTTAMTGHQPNPGTGRSFGNINTDPINMEAMVKGMGVRFVKTVDPYDVKNAEKVMREALDFDGVAVVISECPCPLELKKINKLKIRECRVNQEKCIHCHICVKTIACPALVKKGENVTTDPTQCIGCGMCANVCPKGAIEVKG
jgi:indolepyruvate ferredoxin oxidoreductase alpha subunit